MAKLWPAIKFVYSDNDDDKFTGFQDVPSVNSQLMQCVPSTVHNSGTSMTNDG